MTDEADIDFRARLLYVAGDGEAAIKRLQYMSGPQLDHFAEQFGLKRRITPRAALREFADATTTPRWG